MSHMRESCHAWMSHAICSWVMVMSHMNESYQICMNHVVYECVDDVIARVLAQVGDMSHVRESWCESCHTRMHSSKYAHVMFHINQLYYTCMSPVTNECVDDVTARVFVQVCVIPHRNELYHTRLGHVKYA